MTNQLQTEMNRKQSVRHEQLIKAIEFDLEGSVAHSGGILTGFSVKIDDQDVLLSLKAHFPAGYQIAFVGSDSIASTFCKAVSAAKNDGLRWREDRYRKEEV